METTLVTLVNPVTTGFWLSIGFAVGSCVFGIIGLVYVGAMKLLFG